MNIQVNEIFYSIQGETTTTGFPSLFIRLTGCNLNCVYCDTLYARKGGDSKTIFSLLETIKEYPSAHHITVTGGEPLLQENTIVLLQKIVDKGFSVQVETNGSIDLSVVPKGVRKIVDIKTPSSGEENSFLMKNLDFIDSRDEIKFVIYNNEDYLFSKDFVKYYLAKIKAVINFSPVSGVMSPKELSDNIARDRLPVRLNLQLHKIVGLETELEKGLSEK
ncbi:MAG: radical SAM protein [bacterium]|nr:radical SAM protein [bacterium]